MFKKVKSNVSFPQEEEVVLDFWKKKNIFKKSISSRSKDREFVFYDGPPFATGLPHYGHFVPGTIKDVIPRYKTMKGYRVERRFGWDCHGLPVENIMKKDLNISSRKEIEAYGIEKYNEDCRSIVLRYTSQWKEQIDRLGRWVDFDNCYRTMDTPYMESIWWVFKTMYEKGLIYEGYNILPYSPLLGTPLSNFELNQGGYKEVTDPAVTVKFRIVGKENTYFLAWTTTPWTLVSNLALCVGPKITYVELNDKASGEHYILSKGRISSYYKDESEYEIVAEFDGDSLAGMRYEPLFPHFKKLYDKGAFFVIAADHVTDTDGCGIVHTAPGFGEDDYNAMKKYKNIPTVCPVDDACCFTSEVPEFEGMFVKDTDKLVIERLKAEKKLVKRENYLHSYPFCYRTGAPIIYRATTCYFVDVPRLKKLLVKSNKKVNWVPSHLQQGRFGKWLEGAREWAISRNRFWGNPLPVWKSESGKYTEVIGSVAELEAKCGQKVTDLHKHYVDKLTWKASDGTIMRRIPDILDCWFESGSMPYAQVHYPFENKKRFEKNFPADFICEGLDQTRGWFYTLLVNSVALFGKSPYKNVIVNGIVLNEKGKKMSKSERNFTDPMEIVRKYGADALRFTLMNSPATRAEDLKFSADDVKETIKMLMLPLWNAYSFFVTYANIDKFKPKQSYLKPFMAENPLDKYIISRTQRLVNDITKALDSYYIQDAASLLVFYLDDLNNWYIRRSRKRFWKNENDNDKMTAYRTLYYALMTFIKCACPFIPFVTESIYQNLKIQGLEESIHLSTFPRYSKVYRCFELEEETSLIQNILTLARRLRSEKSLRIRQPLSKLFIVCDGEENLNILKSYTDLIKEEVNVKNIEFSLDEESIVTYSAKANFKALGPRLGSDMKMVAMQVERLSSADISKIIKGQSVKVSVPSKDVEITLGDIIVTRNKKDNIQVASEGGITIGFDTEITQSLLLEGYARDTIREIQNLRKERGLDVSDRIVLYVNGDTTCSSMLNEFGSLIKTETLAVEIQEKSGKNSVELDADFKICIDLKKA